MNESDDDSVIDTDMEGNKKLSPDLPSLPEPSIALCFEDCNEKIDVLVTSVDEGKINDALDLSSSFTSVKSGSEMMSKSSCNKISLNYDDKRSNMKKYIQKNCVDTRRRRSKSLKNKTLTKINKNIKSNFLSSLIHKQESSCNIQSIIYKNMSKNRRKTYSGMKILVNPISQNYIMASRRIKPSSNEFFTFESWMFESPKLLKIPNEPLFILPKSKHSSNCSNKLLLSLPSNSEFEEDVSEAQECSSMVYEEGTMNSIGENYITLSDHLRVQCVFRSNVIKNCDSSDKFEFANYPRKSAELFEDPLIYNSTCEREATVYRSWKSVVERIESLQEETMTKFIFSFKTPRFEGMYLLLCYVINVLPMGKSFHESYLLHLSLF